MTFSRALPVTVAAFLRYRDGPVGAYDELLAAPTLVLRNRRVALPVPLIAVDSEPSIAGGRANWALPKTPASFDWPDGDGAPRHVHVAGHGWSVEATVRWSGPRMPLVSRSEHAQVRLDGEVVRAPIRSRGVGRPARIKVRSEGPTLRLAALGRAPRRHGRAATYTISPAVSDPLR